LLFDNLNEGTNPDITLFMVVSNMLSSGARAFFISPYTTEEEPIARRFPNTLFIHNLALRWDVEDMLPNMILVTTSRQGPPPPGTTAGDVTVWIFGIGGLILAALVVFTIGLFYSRAQPVAGPRRSVATRLIEYFEQSGDAKKKTSKSPGIHAKGLRIEQSVADRSTDFAALGEPEPLLLKLSTYVQDDRHYDESFSIEQDKTFLGECGVGLVPRVNLDDPNKCAALEIWLFDKNDIKTASQFVVSENIFQDSVMLARLKGKGDVLLAEQDAVITLETKTLRMRARLLSMQYGYDPALPARSFFEHVVIEVAVWRTL
jgi:hypothetical protein